ncbi:hypothetical protein BD324DRAFT_649358 [Kockovaella imperatae]|uniref:Phosphatidylinositol N-acetylglucosaminyltransferase subunit H conserved domain-containing protein n=1 Tax=Kockovaella imperatae TaxID=4999 RepID=A0A1Y1UMJ4_9TREE|nr:hypothetical protein BD324DRAFT_649358 [Kockovaella imperatae]ORX39278.1 hypothetical protein BD324DRAFT_649358 [Kockovaella imperatae]
MRKRHEPSDASNQPVKDGSAGRASATDRPLRAHPNFCVVRQPSADALVEYRVYNVRYHPSGRVVRGDGWGLLDLIVLSGLVYAASRTQWTSYIAQEERLDFWHLWQSPITLLLVFLAWSFVKTQTVLYQSITVNADYTLALKTVRGISIPTIRPDGLRSVDRHHIPLRITRHLVALSEVSTIVINECLTRWNARYYLAVLCLGGNIIVPFDIVSPVHAILVEIYHELHEVLAKYDDETGKASHKEDSAEGEPMA